MNKYIKTLVYIKFLKSTESNEYYFQTMFNNTEVPVLIPKCENNTLLAHTQNEGSIQSCFVLRIQPLTCIASVVKVIQTSD